jgi:hypothetical protein
LEWACGKVSSKAEAPRVAYLDFHESLKVAKKLAAVKAAKAQEANFKV